jgi:hypothetical protein
MRLAIGMSASVSVSGCGVLGVAIYLHLFLGGGFLAPKAPSLLSPATGEM